MARVSTREAGEFNQYSAGAPAAARCGPVRRGWLRSSGGSGPIITRARRTCGRATALDVAQVDLGVVRLVVRVAAADLQQHGRAVGAVDEVVAVRDVALEAGAQAGCEQLLAA